MSRMLLRRYRSGTRHASDVSAYLDMLMATARYADASSVFAEAVALVRPVPRLLWRWGVEHIEFLDGQACKRLVDGTLNGVCKAPLPLEAARSGEFLLAMLASLVERVAMDDVERCLRLARPFVDAAVQHRARGFHYDQLALDTITAWECFLTRPVTLDAWSATGHVQPPMWMREVVVQALKVRGEASDPAHALVLLHTIVMTQMVPT